MHHEGEGKIRIGITIGDVNGVGAEVIMKALMDNRILQTCTPVIYGSSKVISHHRKALNIQEFNYNTVKGIHDVIQRKINLINCWEEEIKVEIGKPSSETGVYAYKALQAATADLAAGHLHAIVTAPIDKHTIQPEGSGFTGHTEFFGKAFANSKPLMFLVSGDLRVALVTGHVPVTKISQHITKENIQSKLQIMIQSLKRDFGIRKPRIAVLGLNPHAGDNGVIGNEDKDIIAPAVKEMSDKGAVVFGPYSADGLFGSGAYKKFDAVLAMYHDQGLIPFKTLAFETGVNFTAGLPVIRTSPDHGTGYDIAGKGIASEVSMREAIYMACDIYNLHQTYDEVTANPLAFTKLGGDR
ncbi:MAG TPA: 4-hydroxythreonine-4-phosphate dehydrogenase PdxA [Bacteroidia bacterium]|jgi:4-hydroxythreonine-4-phosphate dehydrogenase|nr:4-hydroxythreonine-4-phosphate dehydrogenase PdxA [Bacteroidia bacterium]HQK96770.1 4-hydroxythreonine-4-phosphate dehydrogenase PdxA [Bacteroidia bacterium]